MSIERPINDVLTELNAVRPTVDQYLQAHGMPAHYADMLAFASTIHREAAPAVKSDTRLNADTVTRLKLLCRLLELETAFPEDVYSDPEALFAIFGRMRSKIEALPLASHAALVTSGSASRMVSVFGALVPECNGSHDAGEIAAGATECTGCTGESETAQEAAEGIRGQGLARSGRRAVPNEVRAAVERMCKPLDESVLSGATAKADGYCMALIREYVLGGDCGASEEMTQPAADGAGARDFVAKHAGTLVRLLGIEEWHDIQERDLKVEVALNRMFRGAPIESDPKYVIRMAAISSAACGYWTTSDSIRPEHDSLTLQDVASLYRKYTRQLGIGKDLRSEIESLKQAAPRHAPGQHLTDEQRQAVQVAIRMMTDVGSAAKTVADLNSLLSESESGK
ncbi:MULTISPECIES: hypothetical protein [Caballeronia]|uniref:hypothetical protein n=1 Tax=Caballeronia TaxID=1827195 RepID=UPI001FD022C6|nr:MULTISPECIES: hypothetical protein [Caballeronia]MDR5798986.1 hypothetical protein [Caballeronia sp. LZ001]